MSARGNSYLCVARGESDAPIARVCKSDVGVRQFFVEHWFGEENDELWDAIDRLQSHNWSDGDLVWEFEIGSMTVSDVYAG